MVRVFLSWSGDYSRQLADALRRWLPLVVHAARPYFTPSDIEKGAKWDTEISNELERTDICIIAMTRESLKSQWIPFEAGAIARTVEKARVCPITFDIDPTDIQGPLTRFQATRFNRNEMRALLDTINSAAGDEALPGVLLDRTFEVFWPELETAVNKIQEAQRSLASAQAVPQPVRSERELIEETLSLMRQISSAQLAAASPATQSTADLASTASNSAAGARGAAVLVQSLDVIDSVASAMSAVLGRYGSVTRVNKRPSEKSVSVRVELTRPLSSSEESEIRNELKGIPGVNTSALSSAR